MRNLFFIVCFLITACSTTRTTTYDPSYDRNSVQQNTTIVNNNFHQPRPFGWWWRPRYWYPRTYTYTPTYYYTPVYTPIYTPVYVPPRTIYVPPRNNGNSNHHHSGPRGGRRK